MARLPTRDDLGARPLPGGARQSFGYRPTPLPEENALGILGRSVGNAAQTVEGVLEAERKAQQVQAAREQSAFLRDLAPLAEMFDSQLAAEGGASAGDGDDKPAPRPDAWGGIYEASARQLRDRAAQAMSNGTLRESFLSRADGAIALGKARIGELAARRAHDMGRGQLLSSLDANLAAAKRTLATDSRIDLILATLGEVDAALGAGFLAPEEAREIKRTWPERYGMAALGELPADKRIEVLDIAKAAREDPEGTEPPGLARLAGFISPENQERMRAQAAREAAEAHQGLAAEVAAATGPELDSIRRTGQETPGFAEKARAVLSTVDMDALGRRTRIAKATHAAGQNMRFMRPDDMTGVTDAYRPAGNASAMSGPEGPAVDATAEAAETHAAVRAEAEAIKARRAADPAGYAMQHPAVRAAFNEALGDSGLASALSGGDGAKLQRAIALRQSLQEAMGIAPADRRLLSNEEGREMIALLAQAAPEQKPVLLRQLRQALGTQADDAIAEMVDDGLDGGMELIARIADHPALAAEAAKAMATPYAALIRGIEPADVKALDARLAERVGPWRSAIEKQPGGRQRAAQQSAVVRAVAFARLGQTGDAEGAADSAFDDLISRSTTEANGILIASSLDGQATKPEYIVRAAENSVRAFKAEKAPANDEGRNATSLIQTSAPQGSTEYPMSPEMQKKGEEAAQRLRVVAEEWRQKDWHFAANMLDRFLDRSGSRYIDRSGDTTPGDIVWDVDQAREFPIFRHAEGVNQQRFVGHLVMRHPNPDLEQFALLRALKDGEKVLLPADNWDFEIDWPSEMVRGENDFLRAVGNTSIKSQSHRFEAERNGNKITVTGVVANQLNDVYDFEDYGMIARFFFGEDLSGQLDDALLAQRTGHGKPFNFSVDWCREMKVELKVMPGRWLTVTDVTWKDLDRCPSDSPSPFGHGE